MLKIFNPNIIVDTIKDIKIDILKENNIKGLILDIDNTLVAWDVIEANHNVVEWIQNLKRNGIRVCLVSNNNKERVTKFNEKLKLYAVYKANKPIKTPFKKALDYLKIRAEETAVIGDQIFTDILGGNRLNMFTILVTPISSKEFPFIKVKRFFERIIIKRYYKYSINKFKDK